MFFKAKVLLKRNRFVETIIGGYREWSISASEHKATTKCLHATRIIFIDIVI